MITTSKDVTTREYFRNLNDVEHHEKINKVLDIICPSPDFSVVPKKGQQRYQAQKKYAERRQYLRDTISDLYQLGFSHGTHWQLGYVPINDIPYKDYEKGWWGKHCPLRGLPECRLEKEKNA